jgi:hypothetical protein
MSRKLFSPPCGFDLADTTIATLAEVTGIAYWSYRVVRHADGTLYLHETYYDRREGILGVARAPTSPCADGLDSLRAEIGELLDALTEPVLDFADVDGTFEDYSAGGDGA